MTIDNYISEHIEPEGDYLYRLWRATNVHLLHGRMASGHLQGRLLKMFVEMIRPQNILEVGTFSGYSTICMAEGLQNVNENNSLTSHLSPLTSKIYTFEINDEQEEFTRPWIEGSGYADRIEFIIGDAITEAPKLGVTFDMVFIDGDKRTYCDAYNMAMSVVRPGGFILADNTLWDGHVSDPAYDRDQQTIGIRQFNDLVASDPRVEAVIIPMRDGLTILRKRS